MPAPCTVRTLAFSVFMALSVNVVDAGAPRLESTATVTGLGVTAPLALPVEKVRSAGGAVMKAMSAAAVLAVFLMTMLCTTLAPPFTLRRTLLVILSVAMRRPGRWIDGGCIRCVARNPSIGKCPSTGFGKKDRHADLNG